MRSSHRFFVPIAVGFLLGCVCGFGVRFALSGAETVDVRETPSVRPVSTHKSVRKAPEVTKPKSEPSRPDESRGAEPVADAANEIDYDEIFAQLEAEGLRLVPKKVLSYLGKEPIQPDGSISHGIAEALRLSPSGVVKVETAIEEAARQLAQFEMERAQIVESYAHEGTTADRSAIVFRIPSLEDKRQPVIDQLLADLNSAVGERNGELLFELFEAPGGYFNGFGRESFDVRFDVHDDGSTEVKSYFSITTVPADNSESPPLTLYWKGDLPSVGRHGYLLPKLPPEMRAYFDDPQ